MNPFSVVPEVFLMRLLCRHLFRILVTAVSIGWSMTAAAHPMVENALDVVIEPTRIFIDARISPEQILLVESAGNARPSAEEWPGLIQKHAAYVRDHLHLKVDGSPVSAIIATPTGLPVKPSSSALVAYHLEYPVSNAPRSVLLDQVFLREADTWTATCIVRFRQSTQAAFETGLLPASRSAAFDCEWPELNSTATTTASTTLASDPPIPTTVRLGPTIRDYTVHGIKHILTGYDHLLFVSALVLAATGIWDLVKVVGAFTLAHTLTLTLSVFNIVTLSERIVEPMIAASIVFVAVQNIFWPERSCGRMRLSMAFAFGLFHGLGFAGGLKNAMAGMPSIALWAALGAFSLGVEIGHQLVVIPLYSLLSTIRHCTAESQKVLVAISLRRICSMGICVAGVYFLIIAVR